MKVDKRTVSSFKVSPYSSQDAFILNNTNTYRLKALLHTSKGSSLLSVALYVRLTVTCNSFDYHPKTATVIMSA